MRARRLRQSILTITQIIAISACLSVFAQAQAQPTPTTPPTNTPNPESRTFSENLVELANRAADLLPVIRSEIEGPLMPWLERIAWYLAALIFTFGFARMLRENAGAGVDLFWWFGRAALCLALMGSGPFIINRLAETGQVIAVGVEDGNSPINQFYVKQRNAFDIAYSKFSEGAFTVKDNSVQPVPGGVLGVLFSTESSIPDATRKLDKISRDMSLLYDVLNFARSVISFGDFFLMMIGSFLAIAMRLVAPVMIALAIDRSIAQKVTYPYAWGVVVLTLIWPIVAIVIKGIAFLGGNLAMALGGNQRLFEFDQASLQIIHNSQQHPVYTVLLAALIMLIAGLSMWASPYIAYQLSVGRVYEGVSTTISSWVGQLVGAGVEYYSSSMAASISRQADITQAEGVQLGEVTRAAAGQDSSNIRDRAANIAAIKGAEGGLTKDLAGIEGGRVQTTKTIEAEKMFGEDSLNHQTDLEKSNIWTRKDQKVAELGAQNARESANIESERHAATKAGYGDMARDAGNLVGDVAGAGGPKGKVVGVVAKGVGAGVDGYLTYTSIQENAGRKQGALGAYTKQSIDIEGGAATRFDKAQDLYREKMKGTITQRASDLTGAVNEGAKISAAGAKEGYKIAVGGYNQAYNLNLGANAVNYAGAVKAAGQVRDASVDAARLRAVAAVVNSVGHNIARDLEQGLTLRY